MMKKTLSLQLTQFDMKFRIDRILRNIHIGFICGMILNFVIISTLSSCRHVTNFSTDDPGIQTLIDGISQYTEIQGTPPDNLQVLIPNYINHLPEIRGVVTMIYSPQTEDGSWRMSFFTENDSSVIFDSKTGWVYIPVSVPLDYHP
ncbi:MAG: hypothetical protein H6650_06300 [Ardenticatenales bacterium]|nr:hypothetical protein [Ardenticatenales bacterium]